MTRYHGGKFYSGKELSKIIYDVSLDIEDKYEFNLKGYCEPFCGMLGVYRNIPKLFEEKQMIYKAGDINKSVVMMWKQAQNGWKPPIRVSEDEYIRLKKKKGDSALKGYVGHQYGFNGMYFSSYTGNKGDDPTLSIRAPKAVVDIAKNLKEVDFTYGIYNQFSSLKGFIIYCDPPYDNTLQRYKGLEKESFDSDAFWKWCRKMAKYNIVFVSEYSGPSDIKVIFSKRHELNGGIHTKREIKNENLYLLF